MNISQTIAHYFQSQPVEKACCNVNDKCRTHCRNSRPVRDEILVEKENSMYTHRPVRDEMSFERYSVPNGTQEDVCKLNSTNILSLTGHGANIHAILHDNRKIEKRKSIIDKN